MVKSTKFYDILNLNPNCSQADIVKAYRSIARTCHPDKCPGDETAVERFQNVQKAYETLKDSEKRSIYDACGDESDQSCEFGDALNHFRDIWPKINLEDITSFEERYRDSEDEKEDIFKIVERLEGDITTIFHHVLIGDSDDMDRFIDIISNGFMEGNIDNKFKSAFISSKKNSKKIALSWKKVCEKENKAFKKDQDNKKSKNDDMASLEALILSRNKQRGGSFLDNLAAKYGAVDEENPKPKRTRRN